MNTKVDDKISNRFRVVNKASLDGQLPLHIAVSMNRKDVVGVLVRLGADISKPDSHARNAVHHAAKMSAEILKVLNSSSQNADMKRQIIMA